MGNMVAGYRRRFGWDFGDVNSDVVIHTFAGEGVYRDSPIHLLSGIFHVKNPGGHHLLLCFVWNSSDLSRCFDCRDRRTNNGTIGFVRLGLTSRAQRDMSPNDKIRLMRIDFRRLTELCARHLRLGPSFSQPEMSKVQPKEIWF